MPIQKLESILKKDLTEVSKIYSGQKAPPYPSLKIKSIPTLPLFVTIVRTEEEAQKYGFPIETIFGLSLADTDFLCAVVQFPNDLLKPSVMYPLFNFGEGSFRVFAWAQGYIKSQQEIYGFNDRHCFAAMSTFAHFLMDKGLLSTFINFSDETLASTIEEMIGYLIQERVIPDSKAANEIKDSLSPFKPITTIYS